MRQVGVFAAAGLYALEHNLGRLAEDHANARRIAEVVAGGRFVTLDPTSVRTNMVVFHLAQGGPDAATVVERARGQGVLVLAFGPRTIRTVSHLDVSAEACERAARVLAQAAGSPGS